MSYTSSFVIGRDPLDSFWGFTLDRGTLDGVAVNDAVISDEGYLLGVVREADLTSCKVHDHPAPQLQRSGRDLPHAGKRHHHRQRRLCRRRQCVLTNLDRATEARKGDQVITTGLGGVFPPDVLVGVIKELTPEPAANRRWPSSSRAQTPARCAMCSSSPTTEEGRRWNLAASAAAARS